jgi:hypothetical protein
VLTLSPATVDGLLPPLRQPRGLSTTKPGRLLKKQLPVRTYTSGAASSRGSSSISPRRPPRRNDRRRFPAHVHVDRHRYDVDGVLAASAPHPAGRGARARASARILPIPILGMDTDNGSDSINEDLLAFCDAEHLTLTRGWQCDQNGRPHRRRIGVCSPRRTTLVHDDRGNRVASPSATVIRSSLC